MWHLLILSRECIWLHVFTHAWCVTSGVIKRAAIEDSKLTECRSVQDLSTLPIMLGNMCNQIGLDGNVCQGFTYDPDTSLAVFKGSAALEAVNLSAVAQPAANMNLWWLNAGKPCDTSHNIYVDTHNLQLCKSRGCGSFQLQPPAARFGAHGRTVLVKSCRLAVFIAFCAAVRQHTLRRLVGTAILLRLDQRCDAICGMTLHRVSSCIGVVAGQHSMQQHLAYHNELMPSSSYAFDEHNVSCNKCVFLRSKLCQPKCGPSANCGGGGPSVQAVLHIHYKLS